MATTSIYGADAAALAGSPVQDLLLARDLTGGGAPPVDERMLQELYALAGSEGRRRHRQRRQRRHAGRHGGLRLSERFLIDLEKPTPAEPGHLQGPMATIPTAVGWLGDLDSNQDCSVQSREFYR